MKRSATARKADFAAILLLVKSVIFASIIQLSLNSQVTASHIEPAGCWSNNCIIIPGQNRRRGRPTDCAKHNNMVITGIEALNIVDYHKHMKLATQFIVETVDSDGARAGHGNGLQ